MVSSVLSASCVLLLSALWTSVSAEAPGSLGKRATLLPRQRTCDTPGWIPACPGIFSCIPPGGICCSDGITYVMPPDTCPDGTEPVATAITDAPSASITPAPTTPPPSPSTVVEYTWYTWTITYYYYYYFYTYYINAYELTSTETTYYTTVSLTATDDAEASSLFTSLSATLSNEIPTQTATSTLGSAPAPTSTPAGYSSAPVSPSSSGTAGTTAPYPTGNVTVPSSTAPAPSEFPGAAARFHSTAAFALGAVMAVPGLLMLWL